MDLQTAISIMAPLRVVKRAYIEEVLARCDGNKARAARHLRLTRQTIRKILRGATNGQASVAE